MLKASCLCQAVQYTLSGPARQMNLCHCTMCQKFSGSAYGAFTRFAAEDLTVESGADMEQTWASSAWASRVFCKRCGSSLRYVNRNLPQWVFVATGLFDSDPGVRPSQHIFLKDAAVWHALDDTETPRFQDWESSLRFVEP